MSYRGNFLLHSLKRGTYLRIKGKFESMMEHGFPKVGYVIVPWR